MNIINKRKNYTTSYKQKVRKWLGPAKRYTMQTVQLLIRIALVHIRSLFYNSIWSYSVIQSLQQDTLFATQTIRARWDSNMLAGGVKI